MEDLLVVKLSPKFKSSPYKKIDINSSYTVSFLSCGKISFINVSGRFNTSSFVKLNGDKIPTNEIVVFNHFDIALRYNAVYYLQCLENSIYPDLKVMGIYIGKPYMVNNYESTYLIYVNGIERKISHFRTIDKKEYTLYSRQQKIKTIFEDL